MTNDEENNQEARQPAAIIPFVIGDDAVIGGEDPHPAEGEAQ